MSYHLTREGRQLGVFSLEDIRAKLSGGELLEEDLGWTPGMTDWRTVAEIALASNPPPAPQAPAAPAPAQVETAPSAPSEAEPAKAQPSPVVAASAAKHRGRLRRRSKPANHLVGAILVTLFCCLPLGIPAIVYASQVDGKYKSGDQTGAHEAARNARNWIRISVAAGVVGALIYVALAFAGVTMAG